MGAIAMNPTLQLLQVATEQVPRGTLNESPAPIQILNLKEAEELSQFAAVFVLVSAPCAEQEGALSQIARNNSFSGQPATLKILDFIKRATTQSKSRIADSDFEVGEVKVNFLTMEANRRGEPLMLTALEFKTLKYLIQNARRVISRDELLNEVWGYENYPSTRTVDNQVSKLRKKLEKDPSRPVHLRTVHGAGYKFMP